MALDVRLRLGITGQFGESCFLWCLVPNIAFSKYAFRTSNTVHLAMIRTNTGGTSFRTMFCSLLVRLTCVFLQRCEKYGSSDQSVHNYGSRTATFIDCARHFVRTLTYALEAQALTDELCGARICFAGAPLTAQSIAFEQRSRSRSPINCENDSSPCVLMNLELLAVCVEPTRDLRLRLVLGFHG